MERDDLVPQNVVARRNVLGNLHQPAVIVVRELQGSPVVLGRVNQANFIDLEELELRLVGAGLDLALVERSRLSGSDSHMAHCNLPDNR